MKTKPEEESEVKAEKAATSTQSRDKIAVFEVARSKADGEQAEDEQAASLDRWRRLRTITQDIRISLESVRAGDVTLKDPGLDLTALLKDGDGLIPSKPKDDEEQGVVNLWRSIKNRISAAESSLSQDPQTLLRNLNDASDRCKLLIQKLAAATIPGRLDEWMQRNPSGCRVSFKYLFKDELPDDDALQEVLQDIASQPQFLSNALVSAQSGIVYSYSTSRAWRGLSLALVPVLVVLTGAVVALACHLPVAGWPVKPEDTQGVVFRWVLVLLGALVHIFIDKVKARTNPTSDPSSFSLAMLPRWSSALLGLVMLKLGSTLIGLFLLLWVSGAQVGLFSAFLIGYSLDSAVALFGDKIDESSRQLLEKMKAKS